MRWRGSPAGESRRRIESGRLHKLLTRNAELRDIFRGKPDLARRLESLKDWQSRRLLRTHKDLHADPRYRAAVDFFTYELYGSGDPRARDPERVTRVSSASPRLKAPRAVTSVVLRW